ncbi:unnamed protein product [Mytilus coruscus]|uniref:Uncharacterized protein n=1 Tax=Mytilus coruscus TaxID=42192 RepID=A0A6J8CDG9_MYTCO|nr:unnamed protein product [Mytilus coruscus]
MADDTEELIDAGEDITIKTSTPRSPISSELAKSTDNKTTRKQKNKENKQEDKNSKTLKNSTNIKEQERTQEKGLKDKRETKKRKPSSNGSVQEKDNTDDDESEEEETEMTIEEKEDMYNAARNGDFLTLHNSLDKKNADINMTWYKENLLMIAIRAGQTEMAEFLIDVGIDYNHKAKYFDLKEKDKKGKRISCYERSCRDLAFDLGNDHIVEVIDVKNKNVFPFVPVEPRQTWQKRPPPPPLPKHLLPPSEIESEEEDNDTSDGENDSGHLSARSQDKNNESSLSDVLDKLNGKDDGYGTMSPSMSPCLGNFNPHVYVPPEKPVVMHKPTKASMALQTHNSQFYHRRLVSKSAPSMRNVQVVGSYAHEKKQWELRREKSEMDDKISVQSLPFFLTHPSSASSRRSSTQTTASSPLAEVSKILGQSRLLKRETERLSTQRSKTIIPTLKINQWCHNSNNVFNRLSKSATNKRIQCSNFSVNREFIRHHRR